MDNLFSQLQPSAGIGGKRSLLSIDDLQKSPRNPFSEIAGITPNKHNRFERFWTLHHSHGSGRCSMIEQQQFGQFRLASPSEILKKKFRVSTGE